MRKKFLLLFWIIFFLVFIAVSFKEYQDETVKNDETSQEHSSVRQPPPVSLKQKPVIPEEEIFVPDLTTEEGIIYRVYELCETEYPRVSPKVVLGLISVESNFVPAVVNYSGTCYGLMQLNKKYFVSKMEEMGISDILDPDSNLRLGIQFLDKLYELYSVDEKVLMFYNMGYNGVDLYNSGVVSNYVSEVLTRSEYY